METLTLTKYHPCYQLGHLYEHLFIAAAKQLFYSRGLYMILDYGIFGSTYEEGVIEIICELYTEEAKSMADELVSLSIDYGIDNSKVSKALQSISAEEPWKLYITDKTAVLKELYKLNEQPWQTPHSTSVIDVRSVRRKNSPIYLTTDAAPRPKVIRNSIVLDKEFSDQHHELLPLFNVLGHWLTRTIGDQIVFEHGLFAAQSYGRAKPTSTSIDLLAVPPTVSSTDIDNVLKQALHIAERMQLPIVIDRFVSSLKSSIIGNIEALTPDTGRILMETGIYMGRKDLLETITTKNIRQILQHCTLEIRYGRTRLAHSL